MTSRACASARTSGSSEEWFTPDGVPGFAIPFYLAHPRLMKLERRQMLEVEGGTERECLRIMRHEAGHAIDNAFRFRNATDAGDSSSGVSTRAYPDSYQPDPTSRDFVLHLGAWYAQAHPAEDFAETFAVWLATHETRWRRRYAGWDALAKLEYVDRADARRRRARAEEPSARTRRRTLPARAHARRALPAQARALLDRVAGGLRPRPAAASSPRARGARRRARPPPASCAAAAATLVHAVARGTGLHHYTLSQLLSKVVERSRLLGLRVAGPEAEAHSGALVLLTVQAMKVVHTGYQRIPL